MAKDLSLATAYVDLKLRDKLKQDFATAKAKIIGLQKDLASAAGRAAKYSGPTFAAGTAAIAGLTAAASPDAINTFTGSVKLLAMVMGRDLIPYAVKASIEIQKLKKQYEELSPATREAVAQTLIYGTAAAGATYLTYKLTTVMATLTGISAGRMAPWIITLEAMAAAAGYTAHRMGEMEDRLKAFHREMDAFKEGKINKEEVEKSGIYQAAQREATPEGKLAVVQKRIDELQEQRKALKAEFESGAGIGLFRSSNLKADQERIAKMEEIGKQVAMATVVKESLTKGKIDVKGRDKSPMEQFLQSMTAMGPKGYSGIEDVRKQMQVAALQDPMQQAMLQEQMKGNQLMREGFANAVKAIEDNKPGLK